MTFAEYWNEKAALVDKALAGLLAGAVPQWQVGRAGFPDETEWFSLTLPEEKPAFPAPRLQEAMAYSLLAPGKRLRPVLVLAAAELTRQSSAKKENPPEKAAVGGPFATSLPASAQDQAGVSAVDGPFEASLLAACAIEMIHTYSLIHDDLPAMDNDDFRRGRPTNHRVYGEALAILAGDALLTLAFEVLSYYGQAGPTLAQRGWQVTGEIARAAGPLGMAGGQVLDLEAEGKTIPLEELRRLQAAKTGALIVASLRTGAILAGGPPDLLEALTQYGHHLGLAFQITDDLLDVLGDGVKTGKGTGRDAAHGKATFPSLLGLAGAQEAARVEVGAAVAAVAPWGEQAWFFQRLANYLLEREK